MPSNWNINRDKISTSWGRRKLPWCQATTAKSRRWSSEMILSYTQRFSHGLLCATTCSDWKEDVPAPRRRRRQIRSEHWARDFLFCTLIAICHSIHPSSLSRLPSTCVNWREAASIEDSLECFDYGTPTFVFSVLGHTHSCTVAFRDFTSVGRFFEFSKTLRFRFFERFRTREPQFLLLRCSRIRGPPVPVLWPIPHQRTSVPSLEVFQNQRTAGSFLEMFQNKRTTGSGSLTNSAPENLSSFSWGVPE
jgi:hypothetical protein